MAMTLITIVSVLSIYQSSLLVSASPFPLGPKIPLQCPSAGPYQAACWASLEVSRYYREWIVSNGPRCDSIGLRDNAAACFIALTTGESFSCGSTGAPSDESKLCPLATFDLGHYTPQEAYVLRAIYGLWKWFQSISTAIETTDPTPGLQLIAAQFDRPNRRFDMTYISFWQTLAAGLFDTPIPGTKSTIVTVYMEEARVNPQFGPVDEAVIPFIFSAATAPYVFSRFDWDPTTPFPMNHIQQYRETLSGGLANLQAGVDPWIALTANGTFATYQFESGADTSNFFKPFYVWILSQWFKDQSVIATVSRNTDAYTFHKYGHDSRFPISCDYYEANNICSAWWHHGAANATYSLDNLSKGKSDKNYYEAMTNLFGSNLFSGADLFLNRDVCENPRPFVIRDGRTVSCSIYAEIQMAEFSPTCNDLGCEFGGEPDSQADWKVDLCFPASYLGDLRSMEGTKFVPCSYRNA